MTKAAFNIVVVAQSGRLSYEALLFVASLRAKSPGFTGGVFVASPTAGPLWDRDPSLRNGPIIEALTRLDARILPFTSQKFGSEYPYGNKIEALLSLPEGEPFAFFDCDTLITDEITDVPFDFTRPSASLRCEGTWPKPTLYGPGHAGIWKSLYDRFGLDFESSLDLSHPEGYWQRHLYFNAGFFYGTCPRKFGHRFMEYACSIRDDTPVELIGQSLDPWLDQIALPLVIHGLGGGKRTLEPGYLDGKTSCHYRTFPLLYARESDNVIAALEEIAAPNWLKKVLKTYEPIKRLVYQGKGAKVRALFDQDNLPRQERVIRNRIKNEGLWMR